jgi:hypothetical protein
MVLGMNWDVGGRKPVGQAMALAFVFLGASWQTAMAQSICAPQIHWQQSFGSDGMEEPYAIKQTADGGYIVGGYWTQFYEPVRGNITSTNHGREDFWIVRLDASGEKLWDRSFGGPESDSLYAVEETADGGFILGGVSASPGGVGNKSSPAYGGGDFWVVRTDREGNKLWDRTFGGSGSDYVRSLQQTADGGFVLGGFSGSPPGGNKTSPYFGDYDFWVVRIDSNGNKLWDRSFGGSGYDTLRSLRQTSDGGFILAGPSTSLESSTKTSPNYGYSDYWLVRLDANGNRLWDKSYGGQYSDDASSVLQTSDGGFLVGGMSTSQDDGNKTSPQLGGGDFWLLRLDANGVVLWDRSFGGDNYDDLQSLAPTSDGGCVLVGFSASSISGTKQSPFRGYADAWLVRLDRDGNQLWDQSFGGSSSEEGRSAQQTRDGGFILAALSYSNNGNRTSPSFGYADFWIVKLAPESPGDCDSDGVPDEADACPDTPLGKAVNAAGCAIDQLCPCRDFDTHSRYVACVRHAAAELERAGLISSEQEKEIIAQAVATNCPPVFNGAAEILFGLPHIPIEFGMFSLDPNERSYLSVLPIDPYTTNLYGVSVLLGEADSGLFMNIGAPVAESSDPAWFLEARAYGRFTSGGDGLISTSRGSKPGYNYYPVEVDLSALNPASVTVQYLCNNVVQFEDTIPGSFGYFAIGEGFYYPTPRFNPFWRMPDGSVGALLELLQEPPCASGSYYPFDRVFVRANRPARQVDFISRVDMIGGGGLQSFSLGDEALGMFNRSHKALGPVLFNAANRRLTVTPLPPVDHESFTGVVIDVSKAEHLEADFLPVELDSENAALQILPVGFMAYDIGEEVIAQDLFAQGTVQKTNDAIEITVDFSALLTPNGYGIELTAFKSGLVAGHLIVSNTSMAGTLTRKGNKVPRLISSTISSRSDVSLGFGLDHPATFTASDGTQLYGNHFRFAPVNPCRVVVALSQVAVQTRDVASFTITGERSGPATPRLNISSDSQQLVLSWTDNTRLFTVESAASLSGAFTTVTNEVDFLDNRSTLGVPINETTPRFFRLRR